MKNIILICVVVLSLALSLSAQSFAKEGRLGIKGKYWFTELDGDIKVTESGLTGQTIDFDTDLGVDDTARIPELELWMRLGNNRFSVSYLEVEHDGSIVKTITRTYKGVTFDFSARIDSELETKIAELLYERKIIENWRDDYLGLLLGAKYIKFDGSLKQVGGTSISRSESVEAPVPVVGIVGRIHLFDKLYIDGKISGVTVNAGDAEATLIDASGGINYDFTRNFSIMAGYRYFDIDVTSKDDEANFTLQGPTVIAQARF